MLIHNIEFYVLSIACFLMSYTQVGFINYSIKTENKKWTINLSERLM